MKQEMKRQEMKTKPKTVRTWYNQPKMAFAFALTAFVAAYFVGSRALDTGSLQQYAITLCLIVFAIAEWASVKHAKGAR
jgi:hypothetical protein